MTTQAVRQVPWVAQQAWMNRHDTGEILGSFSADREEHDLAWEPRMDPVYQSIINQTGAGMQAINRFRVVVRDDTDAPLGIVGKGYQPYRNAAFLEFMDQLVDHGGAKRAGVGILKGGRRVFGVVELDPSQYDIDQGDDKYGVHVFGVNGHDGGAALHFGVSIIRWLCTNGMSSIVPGSTHFVKVRHSGNMKYRIAAQQRILMESAKYVSAFGATRERLLDVRLNEGALLDLREQLIPMPKNGTERTKNAQLNRRKDLGAYMLTSDNIDEFRYTGWGFVNAVAEWDQYGNHPRRSRTEMDRLVDGDQGKIVAKARELVLN